jgi:hypothetical protein
MNGRSYANIKYCVNDALIRRSILHLGGGTGNPMLIQYKILRKRCIDKKLIKYCSSIGRGNFG